MKNRRLWKYVAVLVVALALIYGAVSTITDAKKPAKAKGPKPPKERTVDVVVTKRPTQLKTSGGVTVVDLPEGVSFTLAEHKGNTVWVYGPSCQRYKLPVSDVKIIKGEKVSVGDLTDEQLKYFGMQITAARVTAVMQAAYPDSKTTLAVGMRTEWEDKVIIEMAIKSQASLPEMALMMEWAAYLGYTD